MPTHTIFYSWQSDLPNSVNRGFIEGCLDRAVKALKSDDGLKLDPCVDRDTSGVPGSPDIAGTIFDKIKAADVFVGDVTFIDDGKGRRTPNPNVLIELGFAASCLGWDRIVCVFNLAFGELSDLPFDLRQRRIVSYDLCEGGEKSGERELLAGKLRIGIQSILDNPTLAAKERIETFLSSLAPQLISVLIFGKEFEERSINPWLQSARFQFQQVADSLRQLALMDVAKDLSLEKEIDSLADLLDSAANLRLHSGSWPELSSLVSQSVEKAQQIKESQIDTKPLSDDSVSEVQTVLEKNRRSLDKLSARAIDLINQGRFDDVQSEAARLGRTIAQIGYFNVDRIHPGLAGSLREIGHDLHLVETMQVFADGGRSASAIAERIQKNCQSFDELLDSMGRQ